MAVVKAQVTRDVNGIVYFNQKAIHGFKTNSNHSQVCDSVYVVSDSEITFANNDGLWLYNTFTRKATLLWETCSVYSVCSKHGYIVASKYSIFVYNINTKEEIIHSITDMEFSMLNGVDLISLDGKVYLCLALNENEPGVLVYSLPSMKVVHTINTTTCVNYVSWHPSGQCILAVEDNMEPKIYSGFDLTSSEPQETTVQEIKLTNTKDWGYPQYCCWHPEGTAFAITDESNNTTYFSYPDLQKKMQVSTEKSPYSIRYSPTNQLVAFVTRGVLHITDPESHGISNDLSDIQVLKLEGEATGMCFSRDGRTLFVSTTKGINEYKQIGIPKLSDICISFISSNLGKFVHIDNWNNILPISLLSRIFPSDSPYITFE